MYNSNLLLQLYGKYCISQQIFGRVGDVLGDLYEEFVVSVLRNANFLNAFNCGYPPAGWEAELFYRILFTCGIKPTYGITHISATSDIEHRSTGGKPKTDVIMTVHFGNGEIAKYPLSVKHSTAKKVTFAEFDVGTIVKEVGITDQYFIKLLEKHQTDKSAKNFTQQEKVDLRRLIKPIAKKFVRWVITGSTTPIDDLRIPICLVKFDISKRSYHLKDYFVYNVDEYVDHIMFKKNGKKKRGGFGTGLSWTYATGSGGKKIQFKG